MESCLETASGLSESGFLLSILRKRIIMVLFRINVVESDINHSSDESMAASSIIMPMPNSAFSHSSANVPSETAPSVTESAPASMTSTDDNISDAGSDDISLISMPSSSDDEDEALWHDTRSQTTAELAAAAAAQAAASPRAASMDYVLLYDDNSSEGSE